MRRLPGRAPASDRRSGDVRHGAIGEGQGLAFGQRRAGAGGGACLGWWLPDVQVPGRDQDALRALEVDSDVSGLEVEYCDISVADEVASVITSLFYGPTGLGAVMNNAAILRNETLASRLGKRVKKHSLDDWLTTLNSNLTGTFLVAKEAAANWLVSCRSSVIVNTSSAVRSGNSGLSAYFASKADIDARRVYGPPTRRALHSVESRASEESRK